MVVVYDSIDVMRKNDDDDDDDDDDDNDDDGVGVKANDGDVWVK